MCRPPEEVCLCLLGRRESLVDLALSPDETLLAVACLSSKNLKLLKLCSYKSFVAELRVHIFAIPGSHRLHQVSHLPSHQHPMLL